MKLAVLASLPALIYGDCILENATPGARTNADRVALDVQRTSVVVTTSHQRIPNP